VTNVKQNQSLKINASCISQNSSASSIASNVVNGTTANLSTTADGTALLAAGIGNAVNTLSSGLSSALQNVTGGSPNQNTTVQNVINAAITSTINQSFLTTMANQLAASQTLSVEGQGDSSFLNLSQDQTTDFTAQLLMNNSTFQEAMSLVDSANNTTSTTNLKGLESVLTNPGFLIGCILCVICCLVIMGLGAYFYFK
jgi:hypothetical protein